VRGGCSGIPHSTQAISAVLKVEIGELKAVGGGKGNRARLEKSISPDQLAYAHTEQEVADLRDKFVGVVTFSARHHPPTGGFCRGEHVLFQSPAYR
jgi:hypothetical protein